MSKRLQKFRRVERDFYPTPKAAVEPLIPWIRGTMRTFAEPCCGDGDLVRHLEEAGFSCVYAGDLRHGQDALTMSVGWRGGADAIVTNPPHSAAVLLPMIDRFRTFAPTWLLLPWDFACTQRARPYMRCCRYMVPIGRVRWIEGSPHTSLDNFAWYHFEAVWSEGPRLLLD